MYHIIYVNSFIAYPEYTETNLNLFSRLLMTECDPDVCSAGIRCRNQSFQKREYPPMVPYKTQGMYITNQLVRG